MNKILITLLTLAVLSGCYGLKNQSTSNQGVELPIPSGKAELAQVQKQTDKDQTKAEKFAPQISENKIISGNKELEIDKNGQFSLSSNGESIALFYYFFTGDNAYSGKPDWISAGGKEYDKSKSKFRKEGNKFIYDGFLKIRGISWRQYRLTVELMPDGLIKVETEWFPAPDKKIGLHGHSFWVVCPRRQLEGKSISLNGTTKTVQANVKYKGAFLSDSKPKDTKLVFFKNDPGKKFSVSGKNPEDLSGISVFAFDRQVRASIKEKKNRKLSFYIDIRFGTKLSTNPDTLGGVNFRKIDNLTMPDRSSKNLLRNPSFEQGFHEYFLRYPGYAFTKEKWQVEPFIIDKKEHVFGKKSLRIQTLGEKDSDFRSLRNSANLSNSPIILPPGSYTCSVYAKGDTKGQIINVWFNRYRSGSHFGNLKNAFIKIRPTKDWKRYQFSFKLTQSKPSSFHVNATSPTKKGFVWLDGFQLEKGQEITPFETKFVEGELLSSAKDNFISAKEKINAKMRLNTAPLTKGIATVRVKNFYDEEVFKESFPFRTDKEGIAEIYLPFDGKLGKGLFMIRSDYKTADGKECFDQHRLTVADFLENKHPLKRIYSNLYGGIYSGHDLYKKLDRYRKVGLGLESHVSETNKDVHNAYQAFGIETPDRKVVLPIYKEGTREKTGFGIVKHFKHKTYQADNDNDNILIRDFKLDAGGKITSEYLDKFKKAVKTLVSLYPWVKIWRFGNEFFASFPTDWWSEKNDSEEAAYKFALYQKAFVEGVKEANPKAMVMQDTPCNMSPENGIAETDRLLSACGKLGVKFDLIGFHPYRFSPEAPDLDSDTQTILKILKKHGYSDTTQLYWGEMMHWGPYNIPAWGTKSSSWKGTPITWPGNCTLSYDMGWTEKLSAAWRARSWLVALKYSDRVYTANSGNNNNFSIDYLETPRASQLVSNTLGNLLGDCSFKKDIRFAPYVRAFVFEDAQKRPVAAVWCHRDRVDEGYSDAPIAEVDFGDSLESVIDLMNHKRAFKPGKIKFSLMSAPLFFRGKSGTLKNIISAFENAMVVSGEGISPVLFSANPISPDKMKVSIQNFLSAPFKGKYENTPINLAGNGVSSITLPLPKKLSDKQMVTEKLPSVVTSEKGPEYNFDLSFNALIAKKVDENANLTTLKWDSLPAIPITNYYKNKIDKDFCASYRVAWNKQGIFIEVAVKDKQFSHTEFPLTGNRWDNDCLQVYFDTLADSRSKVQKGYDDNDYDYAVFPDKHGKSSIVWRYYTADQQLGLGIYAPKNNTIAKDIPSAFTLTSEGYKYRVFFPAKYLLPGAMKKGEAIGVGLFVGNANDGEKPYLKRRVSGLSNSSEDGKDCFRKPHIWPIILMWE